MHLHGCIDDPDSMVITTKDYLNHYSGKNIDVFLEHLFSNKTVLFIGYGMAETLTLKQQTAFKRALEKPPLLPLLIQNIRGLQWFDAFAAEGLFKPDKNPKPIEVDTNSFRIPSWNVVEYLVPSAVSLKGHPQHPL